MKGVVLAIGQLDAEEDDGEALVLWSRCYACGHRLAYSASACPQCDVAFDDRSAPEVFPEACECRRCRAARSEASS